KDLQGKTISVGLVACHGYNNTKQFFKDSTFITKKSEGYVYKNNVSTDQTLVGVYPSSNPVVYTTTSGDISSLFFADQADFYVKCRVYVYSPTSRPATGYYFIYSLVGSPINAGGVSLTRGGSLHEFVEGASNDNTISNIGGFFLIDNRSSVLAYGDAFQIIGTVPTDLSSDTTYYCTTALGNTQYEPFNFNTSLNANSQVLFTGTGAADTGIQKVGSSGGGTLINTEPTVWLYGWGYAIPSGSTVALSIPGVSASRATTTGTPVESTDGNGVKYTAVTLTDWLTTDYSNKGFFLNKRLYVNEDLGWV
ncbi:MAG: hypothetical protein WC259_08180, partial [Dehalococcoides sp.]